MTNTDDTAPAVVLAQLLVCAESWVPEARIIGDIRAADISRAIRSVLATAYPEIAEPNEGISGYSEMDPVLTGMPKC